MIHENSPALDATEIKEFKYIWHSRERCAVDAERDEFFNMCTWCGDVLAAISMCCVKLQAVLETHRGSVEA